MTKPKLSDEEAKVPIISLYLDGIDGPLKTIDTWANKEGNDADGVLEVIAAQIPDRGSKWLTIGHVRFNTFNLKAVTVE